MSNLPTTVLRMIRVEQHVFDALKQLRKKLAPILRFKTMSELVDHLVTNYNANPVVATVSPERMELNELKADIYTKLDKIEALLVAKAVVKTVTMNIDNLVGNMVLPEPKASVEVEKALTQAITDALRSAQSNFS